MWKGLIDNVSGVGIVNHSSKDPLLFILSYNRFWGNGALLQACDQLGSRHSSPESVWQSKTLQVLEPTGLPWASMVLLHSWKDFSFACRRVCFTFLAGYGILASSIFNPSYKFAFLVFSHWVRPQRSTRPAWLSTVMVTWPFGLNVQNRRTFCLKFNKCVVIRISALLLWGLVCLFRLQVEVVLYCWLLLKNVPFM